MATSNRVVILSVSDENELHDIADFLDWRDTPYNLFYEPDISGCTAIAVAIETDKGKVLASLPLYDGKGVRI